MDGFIVYSQALTESRNKVGTFSLLIEDDDLEVFQSNITAGRSIICQPHESANALNIAFVLSGKLYHTNKRQYIGPGERFTYKNLEMTHHLSVVEDSVLLMIRRKKIMRSQVNMINSVSDFLQNIQKKDQYTEDHCNRTGNLAVQIATHMALPEAAIENVLFVGKFHDIGKINVPEYILNKPGKLTKEEFAIMEKHPKWGHDIVCEEMQKAGIEEQHFNKYAKIVLEHHEKIDGSGYPNGLKRNEISIEAKVILVADSFDAMTTTRPYRKALTQEQALTELQKYAGIWYDEKIVKALGEILAL